MTVWASAQVSSRATDQRQPASSRATAVLATTGRFLRVSNDTQRWCRRRLLAPVTDLDRHAERGRRRDATQTPQPGAPAACGHCRRPVRRSRNRGGRGDQRWPASCPGRCISQPQWCGFEALRPQPCLVLAGPSPSAGVDDPLAQRQFRYPMPGTHQIPAAVRTGAHRIAGCFLIRTGNRDRHDLSPDAATGPTRTRLGPPHKGVTACVES